MSSVVSQQYEIKESEVPYRISAFWVEWMNTSCNFSVVLEELNECVKAFIFIFGSVEDTRDAISQ
jgi:hypothetical protein